MRGLTILPTLGGHLPIKRENTSSQENMIEVLQLLARPLPNHTAAVESHHVDLPDQDIRNRLPILLQFHLNLGLERRAIPHIDQNQRGNIARRKDLGGTRSERAIRAGDQRGPPIVGLGRHRRSAIALLPETLPGEVLCEEEGESVGDQDNEGADTGDEPLVGHFSNG